MNDGAAARLLDWAAARRIGRSFVGTGPPIDDRSRRRIQDDVAEVVAEADVEVTKFTGLSVDGPATRPWVMSRGDWVERNLLALETILSPFARRVVERRGDGPLAAVRRKGLALQLGGLLGYLARRVLGQYDPFLPPDDRDLLYFVGPNLVTLERRYNFPPHEFRLWLALHEVTHRVQFGGVPWLRAHLFGLIEEYLSSIELDPRKLLETLKRARDEARNNPAWRGLGILFLLMTPDQRDVFRRMQAVMSLLEGHGNYVMDALAMERIPSAEKMRQVLHQRRHGRGLNRMVQRTMGVDVKVRQYDLGERFVLRVIDRAGPEGFSLVWARPENLPTLKEIGRPESWVERVAGR